MLEEGMVPFLGLGFHPKQDGCISKVLPGFTVLIHGLYYFSP